MWSWNEVIYEMYCLNGRLSGVILWIVCTAGTSTRCWWQVQDCYEMWCLWHWLETPCWSTLTDLCVCRCCLCVGSWTRCSKSSRRKQRSLRAAWRQWNPTWRRLSTRWVLTFLDLVNKGKSLCQRCNDSLAEKVDLKWITCTRRKCELDVFPFCICTLSI